MALFEPLDIVRVPLHRARKNAVFAQHGKYFAGYEGRKLGDSIFFDAYPFAVGARQNK